ncbi:MAG TPA: hypothetical protein PK753_00985 [Ignavibacteria bacterium]|nr:hypothetical protein [Ignavibacteria bacterium]
MKLKFTTFTAIEVTIMETNLVQFKKRSNVFIAGTITIFLVIIIIGFIFG